MLNFIDTKFNIPTSTMRFANSDSFGPFLRKCRELGIKAHPARMPQMLASLFILFLTDKNDIVYDPFGGSNTTGNCAEILERRWVTSEIDEKYESQSKIRLSVESPKQGSIK